METIDAGDVPLDRVVDQLFSDVGLRKLIGHHGVACFVLARSGLAPQFYEQLIKNVDTIDATTRNHVAFIVFHGNKSSIVRRPEEGYRAYEHHLDGLSMSKGTTVWIDEYHAQPIDLKFDRELAEKIRSAPRHAPLTYISRAMDLATTILMDRFDVFETALPCLLFVDGSRIREFQVVQLSPKQPMESLYRTVLAPLSDEFRLLEAYWQQRNRVERYRRDQSEALGILDGFPSKLSALDQSLARARAETAAARSASPSELGQLRSERDALNGRCSSYKAAKTLDERVALMPPETKEYAEANEVKKRLADLEAEKRRAYAPSLTGEQREQLAKLSGSINRLRGKLGTLAGTPYGEAKNQLNLIDTSIRRLERSSEQLRQTESSIEKEIEWLNQKKVSSETELRRLEKIDLSSENRTTAEKYEYLRAGGYGEDLLRPHLTIIATDFVAAVG